MHVVHKEILTTITYFSIASNDKDEGYTMLKLILFRPLDIQLSMIFQFYKQQETLQEIMR